jgi:hypothetical protein
MITGRKYPQEALDLAMAAAAALERMTQAPSAERLSVYGALHLAERLSPQLVRYDPATRDVLTALLRREHRPSTPELRPLARRAGVI